MSKTGNWMIGLGVVAILGGLCTLSAAFGEHPDGDLLLVGAALFSTGSLLAAGGIYLKARDLQSNAGQAANVEAAAPAQRIRGGCDLCGSETPVVQCKVHQLNLCGNCLGQHYDYRSCAFVPSPHKLASKPAGKSAAARTRG
jgi:hypothetical protein